MRPPDAALSTKAALEPRVVTYDGAGDGSRNAHVCLWLRGRLLCCVAYVC